MRATLLWVSVAHCGFQSPGGNQETVKFKPCIYIYIYICLIYFILFYFFEGRRYRKSIPILSKELFVTSCFEMHFVYLEFLFLCFISGGTENS